MARQHAIFVVGPDGSGKTEVTTAIERLTGLPRFKCPSEKEWFRQRSFVSHLGFDLLLPHFVEQTARGFVSDRGYPCEWVYSRAYGRMTDKAGLGRIDELWRTRGGRVVVLARRDYSHIQDDLVETSMLPRIHDLYEEFMAWTALPKIRLYTDDYPQDDWEEWVARDVIRWTASELLEPVEGDELEQTLFTYCWSLRDRARMLWGEVGTDFFRDTGVVMEANRLFEAASTAYLYLTSGSPRMALEALTAVERGDLPQSFWERLGIMV